MLEYKSTLATLDANQPAIEARDLRYKGRAPLRYAADEIRGDLKHFNVNLCRLAIDAVAERMRIKKFTCRDNKGNDLSERAARVWARCNMDQLLMPVIVDALALGSAYLIVWQDSSGKATITAESAKQVAVTRDPVSGEVTHAVKRWDTVDASGAVQNEHLVTYGKDKVTRYERKAGQVWTMKEPIDNPLGVVPVIPLINFASLGDLDGYSVIDDLAPLVDALSKVIADMLVASEDVARPRRWATGVDLEEDDGPAADGFIADEQPEAPARSEVVSPFETGNRMFTVESPEAKFGQLPGADLAGYKTAVELLLQQIMSVSALPAHMMGVTSANPSSADAIRAAEASLTARSESRINVLGIALERAVSLAVAIELAKPPEVIMSVAHWASAGTKSTAQEADAVTKLHALGIISTAEAREMMGISNAD